MHESRSLYRGLLVQCLYHRVWPYCLLLSRHGRNYRTAPPPVLSSKYFEATKGAHERRRRRDAAIFVHIRSHSVNMTQLMTPPVVRPLLKEQLSRYIRDLSVIYPLSSEPNQPIPTFCWNKSQKLGHYFGEYFWGAFWGLSLSRTLSREVAGAVRAPLLQLSRYLTCLV